MTDTIDRVQFYNDYLNARTGKYEWRCQRYDGVINKLAAMSLDDGDTVVDLGAGREEFHKRLLERGYRVSYIPIDASIDGVDLNHWTPPYRSDFLVAIELLEHLNNPYRLMLNMAGYANKGIAATTPNPYTTDVLGMDPTHVTEVYPQDFHKHGWDTEIRSFYGQEDDSVLAWKKA